MKTYRVNGVVTISVSTTVDARNKAEAKRAAMARGLIGLCHQCSDTARATEDWVTSGELDGEPEVVEVVEQRSERATAGLRRRGP